LPFEGIWRAARGVLRLHFMRIFFHDGNLDMTFTVYYLPLNAKSMVNKQAKEQRQYHEKNQSVRYRL
jgi:hypothetical protein